MQTHDRVKKLTLCALLIAIEIILSRFLSISTPIVKIGFDFAPLALAGFLLGPGWAFAAGGLADFIGANLFPIGPYFPGFSLVAALCGLTYGLLLHPRSGPSLPDKLLWWRVLAAVLIVTLPLQLGLDTLWLSVLMGKGYWALIPTRILKCAVMIPVQMAVIPLLTFASGPLIRRVALSH